MKINKFSLRTKIVAGYGVAIAFSMIVSGIALYQLQSVRRDLDLLTNQAAVNARLAERIKGAARTMSYSADRYIARDTASNRAQTEDEIRTLKELVKESKLGADQLQNETLTKVGDYAIDFETKFQLIVGRYDALRSTEKELSQKGASIQRTLDRVYRDASDEKKLSDRLFEYSKKFGEARISVERYLADSDPESINKASSSIGPLIIQMSQHINLEIQAAGDEMDEYLAAAERLLTVRTDLESDITTELAPIGPAILKEAETIAEVGWDRMHDARSNVNQTLSDTTTVFWLTVLVAVLSGFGLWFVIINPALQEFNRITDVLNRSAKNVDDTSYSISRISFDLSARAVEAASAVQETVASMAEMSTMITQTADNTRKSLELGKKITERTEKGGRIMEKMVSSMEAIHQANNQLNEMVKIIEQISTKTNVINDIVFKTQLLAFNASIEAARAGQHGKGFAVVAEEVGNLADLSGKAANDIYELLADSQTQVSDIVKNTASRVLEGRQVSSEAAETFNEIAREVFGISSQIQSVNEATREQELGILQTQDAMTKMDIHTQSSTVISEEASDAAQHLRGQSYELKRIISQMQILFFGYDQVLLKSDSGVSNSPADSNDYNAQARKVPSSSEIYNQSSGLKPATQDLDELKDRFIKQLGLDIEEESRSKEVRSGSHPSDKL